MTSYESRELALSTALELTLASQSTMSLAYLLNAAKRIDQYLNNHGASAEPTLTEKALQDAVRNVSHDQMAALFEAKNDAYYTGPLANMQAE